MKFYRRFAIYFVVVAFCGMSHSCSLAKDSTAVKMKIHSLQANLGREEIAVILTDEAGKRFLPISVGGDQALSIQLGRSGQAAKRPLTHDLMANVFKSLKIEVARVTITDLRNGVYYAEIELRQDGRPQRIDSRPSDAIALSLRVNAPIYTMPHLLQTLSDLPNQENEERTEPAETSTWGMRVQALTENLANFFGRHEGVLVADVAERSPASQSGIQAGDIILRLGQKEIRDVETFRKVFAARKDTSHVEIGVLRGDRNLLVIIKK